MDPDQSPESQAAQMCIDPDAGAVTSAPGGGDAPAPDATGPADGGGNPMLAAIADAGSSVASGGSSPGSRDAAAAPPDGTGGSLWDVFSLGPSMGGDKGSAITGGLGGVKDMGTGISELFDGKIGSGIADLGKGALETGAGAIGLMDAAPTSLLGKVGGALGGVAGLISGGEDINTGFDDASKSGKQGTTGDLEVAKGGMEVSGGAASLIGALGGGAVGLLGDAGAALAAGGAAAASVVGSVLAAGAAGVGAGIGMEKVTGDSGLYHENGVVGPDGKPVNMSGSDIAADIGTSVAQWIDPSKVNDDGSFHSGGQSTFAELAGGAATLAATPVALGADLVGTAYGGYNWLKSVL